MLGLGLIMQRLNNVRETGFEALISPPPLKVSGSHSSPLLVRTLC